MRSDREKLLPWLIQRINSGEVPGLQWMDKEKTTFRVTWKHAGKPDFNLDKDAVLFRKWAEHTGKYKPGEQPDPSTWKTRFRCALRKQPDIVEIPIANSLDESEPYRVFRLKNSVISSSRTSSVSPVNTPSPSHDVMEMYSYASYPYANDVGGTMTGYSAGYELPFPSPDSSSTSSSLSNTEFNDQPMCLDDDDLDNITPTLPPMYNDDANMTSSQTFPPSDYDEFINYAGCRGHVTHGMFDGVIPETQQIAEGGAYNFGMQGENELSAQLGFLVAMFGPSLIQEIMAQQPPANFTSTTAQCYRDIGVLNSMANLSI